MRTLIVAAAVLAAVAVLAYRPFMRVVVDMAADEAQHKPVQYRRDAAE